MTRILLGKRATKPHSNWAADLPELTSSERLQLQSEQVDSTSWPAGESNPFADSAEVIAPPAVPAPVRHAEQHSVVGHSILIQGQLQGAENLTIAGRLEGSITHTGNRLVVTKAGVVKADIQARNLIVEGRVEGDIHCRTVILKDTAHVTGAIRTARISIADGARFNGKVTVLEEKA